MTFALEAKHLSIAFGGLKAVDDLSKLYGGKGGYWEDGAGYEWYAGI